MTTKPKGLAKTWREVKRPFGRLYHYTRRKLSGMSRKQYAVSLEWKQYTSEEFYICDDGRVNLPQLDLDIVMGCNLRCCHCNRLSPYRKGFVPTEKIIQWSETWSRKIRPAKIHILGGEPFLHPDLATVLIESRRIWNDSILEIVSNGLLISQVSQNVFDVLKETKIEVVISDHSGSDLSREKIVASCASLKENGISYELRKSNDNWLVQHQMNKKNVPIPFQSHPFSAWSSCYTKRCPSLMDNLLYKCVVLASMIEGVKEGSLSSALWKNALTYKPLTPDVDANAILKHFCSKEVRECSICPDKAIVTEATQIPHLLQFQRKAS